MTLRVPFEGFADAVHRTLGTSDCYVFSYGARVVATAGMPQSQAVVISSTRKPMEEARKELRGAGLKVYDGLWSSDDDRELLELPYVVAVSYQARAGQPGLWVDAYSDEPNEAEVISKLLAEFAESGDSDSIEPDVFMSAAKPTILVLNPNDLAGFVERNGGVK